MLKFSLLLFILSTFNVINGELCDIISCPTPNSMRTKYVPPISVQYPFRVTNQQRMSCGYPGFELYCDYDQGGTFIKLPNNVTFGVSYIYYDLKQMALTDPDGCLPGKFISLNLTGTPFHFAGSDAKTFLLYNCSGSVSSSVTGSDRIDCLSGSNYSVISTSPRSGQNCKFVTTLTLRSSLYYQLSLNYLPGIYLAWNGAEPSSGSYTSAGAVLGMVFGFLVLTMFTIMSCCCFYKINSNRTVHTGTNTSTESSRPTTTLTSAVTGLNKITIDSYPVVVLGESGRLIKPDNTCAICLSDYCPKETLKIMPECLHRFHVECIDQWLGSKGICPICRIPTPCRSLPH